MFGNPPGPGYEPSKQDLADWMQETESLAAGGGLSYVNDSVQALNQRSGVTAGQFALVLSAAAEAGVYERTGGAWVKRADIPALFVESLAAQQAVSAASEAKNSEALVAGYADDAASFAGYRNFQSMAGMVADKTLNYGSNVSPGDVINIRGDGFCFDVVAAGAGDADLVLDPSGNAVKVLARPLRSEFVDLQFAPAADGVSDDTGVYSKIATRMTSGKVLRVSGSETRIIGASVAYPSDDTSFDLGVANFKKKDSTPDLRHLFSFDGARSRIRGGRFDCNVAAGGMGGYVAEDRHNTVQIMGDDATLEDAIFEGSYDFGPSAALFLGGARPIVRRVTVNRALRNAIRVQSDRALLEDIVINDMDTGAGGHGIVLDAGLNFAPFKTLTIKRFTFITSAAAQVEAFLVDHDGVQGGSVYVEDFYLENPNGNGPDFYKVAYCDDATFVRFRGSHGFGSLGVSLRIQQGVKKVILDDCEIPASIAQDPTVSSDIILRGGTHIGKQHSVEYGLFDFAGNLLAERGTKFSNIGVACIATDPGFPDSTFDIGPCHFHGTGASPYVVVPTVTSGTNRRLRMGQIRIAKPLSTSGTFRNFKDHGRWVAQSDAQEVVCLQDGRFYGANSQFPFSTEVEGCERGMIIWRRGVAAGSASAGQMCVWPGAFTANAWTGSATYSVGDWSHNDGEVYGCVSGGTADVSGGPTGTGTGIVDGGVTWDRIDQLAKWKNLNAAVAA
jgi:hypothetical protein